MELALGAVSSSVASGQENESCFSQAQSGSIGPGCVYHVTRRGTLSGHSPGAVSCLLMHYGVPKRLYIRDVLEARGKARKSVQAMPAGDIEGRPSSGSLRVSHNGK